MHKGDNAQVRSDTQRPYHVRSCLRAINCDMAITLALEALSLCSDFRLLVLTGPLLISFFCMRPFARGFAFAAAFWAPVGLSAAALQITLMMRQCHRN